MPRIIAGTRKKMILKAPATDVARPTTDRIKETIFNIIAADVPCAAVLDLFAGTGQIGLEALSRGADRCVFVEKNGAAFSILMENIKKTGFINCKSVRYDSLSYIDRCDEKFDLIYIDPPYNAGLYDETLKKIVRCGIMKENAKIIVEHDLNVEINDNYGILDKYREEKYGRTIITFMIKRE